MKRLQILKSALIGGVSAIALASPAAAKVFDIPDGELSAALTAYMKQSNVEILYADDLVRGRKSHGARGEYTETAALTRILEGTGLAVQTMSSNAIEIVPAREPERVAQVSRRAAPAPMPAAPMSVETVVVTAQHKSENIQQVPISVTALSQAQLTERQIAGGPDLLRDVPNMDFTKTNFSGYNIELRGIGTQAISVTTDPAVAVAFNDTPFIRNHFFEQEFFDLQDVEVLRGPQGTLYGRNATAGVVNLKSTLPTDTYEAMLSADIGNYSNRRYEGMVNIPIVGDKLDLRIAGEWTKRDGYTTDTTLDMQVDGRDLWSGRVTLGWKPTSDIQTYLIWEHFSEDDDRLRSGKQLCDTDPDPVSVDGIPVEGHYVEDPAYDPDHYLTQGCQAGSLYTSSAFGVPNGNALAYAAAIGVIGVPISQYADPYLSTTQSTNLRDIQSAILPHYRAKNDTLEYNADWNISNALTLSSQTGYNNDFLFSTEDYDRFDTTPGVFILGGSFAGWQANQQLPDPNIPGAAIFCDPQIGCSDRIVAEDLSDERAWQFSQEFRLASHYDGPLNFSAGGNYLHYETVENYYVFINTLTYAATEDLGGTPAPGSGSLQANWIPGVSDNSQCVPGGFMYPSLNPFANHNPTSDYCSYIDPNPIGSLNNEGHNYFLSQNPYVLNSYALFGEVYYDIEPNLKFTAGARWTEDQKHFLDIPSELLEPGYGYPVTGIVNQRWDAPTGRAVLDWTPNLDFTDQTLVYGSYAHGYKAGGANPPGAELLTYLPGDISSPIHPFTFKPEFIDAFELGTKNTLLDNSLTIDGDIFYYAYTGYQISEIVDRTAINNNYNASVRGAEFEANWEPAPGLKFGFTGGWEDATANNGDEGIDLMDRTAGNPNWIVVRPFITQASNCILPTYVVAALLNVNGGWDGGPVPADDVSSACGYAYTNHYDPVTFYPYVPDPTVGHHFGYVPPGYQGFNPLTAPNNGEGFDKQLGGNQLPNAPHFTTSLTAEYSTPVSDDWVATFHTDFYWQSQSWARIFNDNPYDKIHGYSNVNLSLILNSSNGWQVMAYIKNLFNVTAITGDFLNSDDTGLTTNVFLTDPRLFGVRVTKQLDQADGFWGGDYSGYDLITDLFSDTDKGRPPLWIELGGQLSELDGGQEAFSSPYMANRPAIFESSQKFESLPSLDLDETGKVSFEPDGSDWVFSGSIQYGRTASDRHVHQQTNPKSVPLYYTFYLSGKPGVAHQLPVAARFADTQVHDSEKHVVIDFQAGKDVGLGMFGDIAGSAVASAGVRFASFSNYSNIALKSDPDLHTQYSFITNPNFNEHHEKIITGSPYHLETAGLQAKRSFRGVGPSVSWNASMPVVGSADNGEFTFDWGLNGALLFGRQKATVQHHATERYHPPPFWRRTHYVVSHYSVGPRARARSVTVPNLGGFMGISMQYNNAKVSFGYRADEFFGAMDGGIDAYKSENRGFFGPFANLTIGLGG